MNTRIIFTALFLFSCSVLADSPVSTGYWGNTAIGGYDSVSYHAEKNASTIHPTLGDKEFVVHWNGADWQFATQASADRFAANPEQFRPEYNGHCSNALSLGEGLISTDGTVWEFFGDKLHLFYAERGRQRWLNGDWQRYKQQADAAWQRESNR